MGHVHCGDKILKEGLGGSTIVLAGNPNVGKSVFFKALTGLYVEVSNFPGTTVDISRGKYKDYQVLDTPGVYGVSSFNEEETVARDVILFADIILNIVDATHLDRDLFLTRQLIDMGKPMVVALNMMDEVRRNGISIDLQKLENMLGVPVIPASAVRNEGVQQVIAALEVARVGKRTEEIVAEMNNYIDMVDDPSEALLIAEDDEEVAKRHNLKISGKREAIYKIRRKQVDKIIQEVLGEDLTKATFKTKLGAWMLNPITGIPILLVTLYLMFQFIGVFVAGTVVGFTEETVMGGYYAPFITNLVTHFVSANSFIGTLLIGEFGILTMAPIYILGLLLPLVIGFYLLMSILEDSGYLPRIAALTDRLLNMVGLNGKAIIPIILGFGCVTMATITTRILGTKREKIIATFLLGLAIPCSAQLGVIAGLISRLGAKLTIIYVLSILLVFGITGALMNKFMPGESSPLLIDLPSIRVPVASNVLLKTGQKTFMFLQEATPLFILGAFIITVLQFTGALVAVQNIMIPLTVKWLELPKETATAFIMGIIRRDFGAAGLTGISMTNVQTLVSLVVMTLFVPCIAAIMVIFKERGFKDAFIMWIGSFVVAFTAGGILAKLL